MQEIIQFLFDNLDVLEKVKEGTASLVGVNAEELKAIYEVFFDGISTPTAYFWE